MSVEEEGYLVGSLPLSVVDNSWRVWQREKSTQVPRQRLAKAEKEKSDLDKYFEENIEDIIKKFNKHGVDMKIRNKKRT